MTIRFLAVRLPGFTLLLDREGQLQLVFLPPVAHEIYALLAFLPFGPSGLRPTTPSADFCLAIGSSLDFPSPDSGTASADLPR